MKIGIVGRSKDTARYENFLLSINMSPVTSLSIGDLSTCKAFIFPGGGDINPELFGESNQGSTNIDTELDIIQLRILHYAMSQKRPILGICKGMQLINVALGGTIIQHLPTAHLHTDAKMDVYHATSVSPYSYLYALYGEHITTNSRHHQAVGELGEKLRAVQWCKEDKCIEAIEHTHYPIWGVQWHPERLDPEKSDISSIPLFSYVLSFA